MTPTSDINIENLEIKKRVDSDYKLNENTITGKVSGTDHLKQTIYWLLNTERYQYIIYNWDIGIETNDLYGMPYDYVCSQLESRIKDTLSIDDRIEEIYDFEFESAKTGLILCKFKVKSIYGEFENEREVFY